MMINNDVSKENWSDNDLEKIKLIGSLIRVFRKNQIGDITQITNFFMKFYEKDEGALHLHQAIG